MCVPQFRRWSCHICSMMGLALDADNPALAVCRTVLLRSLPAWVASRSALRVCTEPPRVGSCWCNALLLRTRPGSEAVGSSVELTLRDAGSAAVKGTGRSWRRSSGVPFFELANRWVFCCCYLRLEMVAGSTGSLGRPVLLVINQEALFLFARPHFLGRRQMSQPVCSSTVYGGRCTLRNAAGLTPPTGDQDDLDDWEVTG
jgi:hypothetical protein